MLSAQKRIIRNSVILAGVFLMIVAGCDRAARHKVLTFFFEGVPPLDSNRQAAGTQTVAEESPALAAANQKAVRIDRQTGASRHEPSKDCYQCHMKQGGWNQERLAEPLPELCYSCHTNYSAAGGYLHGPVAVGECLFCHDAHQSKYLHLQKTPQPQLCYQCHLPEDLESVAQHQNVERQICTECHDPHIGSTRNFLKSQVKLQDASNFVDLTK